MARTGNAPQTIVGLALLTSANGTARNGAAIKTALLAQSSVSVKCESRITTASVLATYKIQVTDDATETIWYDLKLPNNASNVGTAVGTGVEVITYLALTMDDVSAWTSFRVVATLSGAATAAADLTKVDYKVLAYGYR